MEREITFLGIIQSKAPLTKKDKNFISHLFEIEQAVLGVATACLKQNLS
jgi:hypothetical protein